MTVITISHTRAEGTLIDGDVRPHHPVVKTAGFRWGRQLRQWYLPRSRDLPAQQGRLDRVAGLLRDCGFEVVVEVDDTARSFAEQEADRAERSAARAEGLAAAAERAEGRAETAYAGYRQIADMIPLGQPVLVGHHSEGRHRRDLARIDRLVGRSVEETREAQRLAGAADAARHSDAQRADPGWVQRRILDVEAEIRRRERHDPLPGSGMAQALEEDRDRLGYWQQVLAELVAGGVKVWGPADFAKGDRVNGNCLVVRVNPKTLTVRHDVWGPTGHTNPLPYNKVRSHQPQEAPAS